VLLSLVSLLASASLTSQDSTPCLFDTAAHTVIDTATVGLVPAWREGQPIQAREDYLLAAQAIQNFFQHPMQLRLPFWARTVSRRGQNRVPGLYGFVRFRLDRLGRLPDADIQVDMASDDVGESIVAAIKRADSASAFSPPSPAVLHDHGTVRLRFGIVADTGRKSIRLMRLVIPAIVVDSEPAVISLPPLTYPEMLRRAGFTDRILLQFVVLSNGRIDESTLDLLHADYREFAVEAIHGVREARFRPARIGTCAVPTVVALPIDFKIRGR
jgi:TonB-like protein